MKRKRVFAKSSLLLGSIAISLVLVEAFARVYLAGPIALLPRYGNSFQAIFVSSIVHKIEGSSLPWELKPNLDAYYKLTKFDTNSRGLRSNREFDLQKSAGTYRVAVIGDSYTMPSGVPIEDAYHSVLERSLNASSAGEYEFLNFGVGGYSLKHYLTVLKEKALEYRPDHVLIGLCLINDIPVLRGTTAPTKCADSQESLLWILDPGSCRTRSIFPCESQTSKEDLRPGRIRSNPEGLQKCSGRESAGDDVRVSEDAIISR